MDRIAAELGDALSATFIFHCGCAADHAIDIHRSSSNGNSLRLTSRSKRAI